jgi:hypothetical protein
MAVVAVAVDVVDMKGVVDMAVVAEVVMMMVTVEVMVVVVAVVDMVVEEGTMTTALRTEMTTMVVAMVPPLVITTVVVAMAPLLVVGMNVVDVDTMTMVCRCSLPRFRFFVWYFVVVVVA